MLESGQPKEPSPTLLSLEEVFELTRFREGHCFACPDQRPRTFAFSPFGASGIVVLQAAVNILGKTDIERAGLVLDDVNAIHIQQCGCSGAKSLSGI